MKTRHTKATPANVARGSRSKITRRKRRIAYSLVVNMRRWRWSRIHMSWNDEMIPDSNEQKEPQ